MDRFRRLIFPAILGIGVYFAVFGGEHSAFDLRETQRAIEAEARELEALHEELDALRARVDSLESDPATLERLARERFGMIQEGEVLYRFADPSDSVEEEGAGPR